MRLIRWLTDEGPHIGRVDGTQVTDLGLSSVIEVTPSHLLQTGSTRDLATLRLAAPVQPGKIIAIGLNYRDHAEETGAPIPVAPLIFAKFPSATTGPFDEIERLPETAELDYEGELGVVVGRGCRDIRSSEALDHVLGYVVANDVSARDAQFADGQWVRGKSFDTFAPFGPWVITADEVPDPAQLDIVTRVNGHVRQRSNTKHLIFGVAELVAYCSRYFSLEPGDLILTGTPGGVGFSMSPPCYLVSGDVVEVEVPAIGAIRNVVVDRR